MRHDRRIPCRRRLVAVELSGDDQAVIHAVLPRRRVFARRRAVEARCAANIGPYLVSGLDGDSSAAHRALRRPPGQRRVARHPVSSDLRTDLENVICGVGLVAPGVGRRG
jgi:hypothetical protein